ncbi:MAG: hypothetical protein M1828_003348 [Chrysothrix sp. TS-e1954]|nr:MAG: hypothetical protein M1828_003348 [Chrysothrix sp. TS-e1954]
MSEAPVQIETGCSAYGGRGALVLGLTWAEFTIATFLMCLRIYTRLRITSDAGWALFWSLLTWVSLVLRTTHNDSSISDLPLQVTGTVTQVLLTLAVYYGLGNHVLRIIECSTYVPVAKWSIISGSFGLLPIGLSKVAIVAFLLAILGPTKKYQRWLLIFLAASNVAMNIMQLLKTIYRCSPPEAAWDLTIVGKCHSMHGWSTRTSYLVGIWNVISDFILALYPITVIASLQMAFRIKLGLSILMSLGLVAAVCGIMRTVLIPLAYSSRDESYDSGPEVIWIWTEMWLVLILSCIPPLWPLFKRCFRGLRSEALETSGAQPTGGPSDHSISSASRSVRKLAHRLWHPKRPSPPASSGDKERLAPSAKPPETSSDAHSRTTSDHASISFVTLRNVKDTGSGKFIDVEADLTPEADRTPGERFSATQPHAAPTETQMETRDGLRVDDGTSFTGYLKQQQSKLQASDSVPSLRPREIEDMTTGGGDDVSRGLES